MEEWPSNCQRRLNFESLCFAHRLFEKHDIEYMIVAGTLLGSVRSQQIIPHDDDVDLGVWTEDLSKIGEVVQSFQFITYSTRAIYSYDRSFATMKFFLPEIQGVTIDLWHRDRKKGSDFFS